MTYPQAHPKKAKCSLCLGVLLVGLLLVAVAYDRVVKVAQKVFSGDGMKYCCSIEGVPFNYLAVFVLLCGLGAALLFAFVLQVREWRIRRDFERKYSVKVPAPDRDSPCFSGSHSGPSLHGIESGD